MRTFRDTSRPRSRSLVLLGGFAVVGFTLLVAFSGAAGAARSQGNARNGEGADPPFGLFETEAAARQRSIMGLNASSGDLGSGRLSTSSPTGPQQKSGLSALAASSSDTSVSVGQMPTGVAVNATRAYVANAQSNSVSVIDLTAAPPSVIATVPVGTFPVGVALSPDSSQVYVTNYNANSVSIISTATNTVTNTVAVGSRPNGIIRVGSSVYVANLTGASISIVNPATASVTGTIALPGSPTRFPSGLATNAAGDRLYASDTRNGRLIVIDIGAATPTVLSDTTAVGGYPAYLSVAGTTGYVANPGSGTVSVVNLAATPPTVSATVTGLSANYGIVAQPSLGQVLVTNSGSNNLSVINTSTNTVVGSFATGTKPNAIALTPDGTTAVLSNQGSNTVSVMHVNQPPVDTVPGAQTVNGNGSGSANTLVFSAANSNAISTTDPDAGADPVKATLTVDHGTLTLATTAGLSFDSGANGTGSMAVTGTVTDINAALAGLVYTPTTGYFGPDTLAFSVDDQGNTGIGRIQVDTDTVLLTVQNVAPVVGAVSFSGAVGNTVFGVGTSPTQPSTTAAGTVLSNSSDPNNHTLTAVAGAITSTNGATVNMNANGTFTYITAPGGATGNDTFTFQVTDGIATTNGTATVTVANRVWYVNSGLGSNGNGTSTSPFNTLANLRNGADVDSPGDVIFLYQGSGNYGGGLPLEANQRLVGQPEGLVVNSVTLLAASGSNPTITNVAGAGITLANDTSVQRVNVASTSGAGITGTNITNASIGPNLTVSGSSGSGFELTGNGTGAVTMAGNITHSNSSSRSVSVANRTGGSVTFSGAVNDSAGGIALATNTGATIDFSGGVQATATGAAHAFSATGGGTVTVTGSANTLNHPSGTGSALNVQSTTIGGGGLTFQSIGANGSTTGILLNTTGSGPLTVAGTGAAGTGGTIQNTTGAGISLTGVGGGVSLTNMATTNVAGADVLLNGGAADFTYTGTVTNQSGMGQSVNVSNRTGGTALLSGAINDNGNGISLSSNTGATINFTGGLTLSTGGNAAFSATGGGTVNVTGSANTITTTTGTALNVVSTSVGASGLTFRSIAAGTGASGPASAIVMSNTGSTAGLTVTGTGSDGTGGHIQRTTGDAVVLANTRFTTLKHMILGDSTAVAGQTPNAVNHIGGDGIDMNNADDVVLENMRIARTGNHGIDGTGVTNLSMVDSEIYNAGDANGDNAFAFNDFGANQNNLDGTVTITNVVFDGFTEDGINVENFTGTLNMTVSGSRFANNTSTLCSGATCGENGLLARSDGTSVINLTVKNNGVTKTLFDGIDGNGLFFISEGTSATPSTLNVTQTTIQNSKALGLVLFGGTGDHTSSIQSRMNFTIGGAAGSGVSVTGSNSHAMSIQPNGKSIMRGTVSHVTVTGSILGRGIEVLSDDVSTAVINISNNTISNTAFNGIFANNGDKGVLDIHIRNNNVSAPTDAASGLANHGIEVNPVPRAVADPVDFATTTCLDIAANVSAGGPNGGAAYRVRQRAADVTFRLERLTGSVTDPANIVAFLEAQNTSGNGSATVTTGYTAVADGACADV